MAEEEITLEEAKARYIKALKDGSLRLEDFLREINDEIGFQTKYKR